MKRWERFISRSIQYFLTPFKRTSFSISYPMHIMTLHIFFMNGNILKKTLVVVYWLTKRGRGLKPHCRDPFKCTFHLDQSMEQIVESYHSIAWVSWLSTFCINLNLNFQGNVDAAFQELNKATLKPFLMRIWGQAEPGEVTSGSAAPREKGEERIKLCLGNIFFSFDW